MAYRIVYECDTLEEFDRLQEWIRGSVQRRRPTGPSPIFRRADLPALRLLADSLEGLRTDDLAAALKITNASLPPTLSGWGRRAAALGLALNDLIDTERIHEQGRPITVYRLTTKGRELLDQQLQLKEHEDGAAEENR